MTLHLFLLTLGLCLLLLAGLGVPDLPMARWGWLGIFIVSLAVLVIH